MNKKQKKDISYLDVLEYYIPKYKKSSYKYRPREFVEESNVNITGVTEYKPYNVRAVQQFRNFLQRR